MLQLRSLYPYRLYPHMLRPYRLYFLANSFIFNTYIPALILYTLGRSLGPQAYKLPLLASPLGPLFIFYPILVRTFIPGYFRF